jgi:hypothetical protein
VKGFTVGNECRQREGYREIRQQRWSNEPGTVTSEARGTSRAGPTRDGQTVSSCGSRNLVDMTLRACPVFPRLRKKCYSASIFSYVPGGDIPAPQRNAFHDEARECCQPGSKPFDLNTGAAVGPVRNRMRAFAASCALEPAPIPPVKTVRLAYSPGSGPTN